MARPAARVQELAFAGIHIISPRIFGLMDEAHEPQTFPIIPEYLRLAGMGETILGFRADGSYWRDLGTPASLQQAADDVASKVIEVD
jgi:NDP-sugar pyrophosphorylase family protein